MGNQLIIVHIKLGLFIHHMMQISPIFSIDINIVKNKLVFYPSFIKNNSQISEWYENKKEIIEFTEISNQPVLSKISKNYQQFINHIRKQNPFIKNFEFVNYLKNDMKKDNQNISLKPFNPLLGLKKI